MHPSNRGLTSPQDPPLVTTLARGLAVLETFATGRHLSNVEIAEETGLPRATVTRLTLTLSALGYLGRDTHSRKYFVGAGLLGLNAAIHRNLGVQTIAREHMKRLMQDLRISVGMGTRDRLNVVMLEAVRLDQRDRVVLVDAGSTLSMLATALGMAYLVAAPLAERTHLLEQLRVTQPSYWATARANVERAHREYDKYGFVVSLRSSSRSINAVGAPLVMPDGGGIYTFTCAGAPRDVPRDRLIADVGPNLVAMIDAIRSDLQHFPPVRVITQDAGAAGK